MTCAWHFIQEINESCFRRQLAITPDTSLQIVGDTNKQAKSNPTRAGRLVESLGRKSAVESALLARSRALKKSVLKDTGMSVEQWEWRCFLEREKERERREKEARKQDPSGPRGRWDPDSAGI